MTTVIDTHALPAGFRLHWYRIDKVLSEGGFGITYRAHDENLDAQVAIKEYLPVDVAVRASDATVRARSHTTASNFEWGLKRFLNEARVLSRLDHPNIVRVHSVFEANGTAYIVMRYESGRDMNRVLSDVGTISETRLEQILLPILDGLERVHEAGYIHRDIKPGNIVIRDDGTPVLIDFGAARRSAGESDVVTSLVTFGYSPLEQFSEESRHQGPWTDIYALGATLYHAIMGIKPPASDKRTLEQSETGEDPIIDLLTATERGYSASFLGAVAWAMRTRTRERPQSVAEWRERLLGVRADYRPASVNDTVLIKRPTKGGAAARQSDPASAAASPSSEGLSAPRKTPVGPLEPGDSAFDKSPSVAPAQTPSWPAAVAPSPVTRPLGAPAAQPPQQAAKEPVLKSAGAPSAQSVTRSATPGSAVAEAKDAVARAAPKTPVSKSQDSSARATPASDAPSSSPIKAGESPAPAASVSGSTVSKSAAASKGKPVSLAAKDAVASAAASTAAVSAASGALASPTTEAMPPATPGPSAAVARGADSGAATSKNQPASSSPTGRAADAGGAATDHAATRAQPQADVAPISEKTILTKTLPAGAAQRPRSGRPRLAAALVFVVVLAGCIYTVWSRLDPAQPELASSASSANGAIADAAPSTPAISSVEAKVRATNSRVEQALADRDAGGRRTDSSAAAPVLAESDLPQAAVAAAGSDPLVEAPPTTQDPAQSTVSWPAQEAFGPTDDALEVAGIAADAAAREVAEVGEAVEPSAIELLLDASNTAATTAPAQASSATSPTPAGVLPSQDESAWGAAAASAENQVPPAEPEVPLASTSPQTSNPPAAQTEAGTSDVTENPTTQASTTEPPALPADVAVPQQASGPVAELLRRAEIARSRRNFTIPADSSAVALYRKVLQIDPDNVEATRGLRNISNVYVDWATKSIGRGQLPKARQRVDRAGNVWPQNPRLPAVARQLAALEALERPVRVKPTRPDTKPLYDPEIMRLLTAANADENRGRLAEARTIYKKMLVRDRSNAAARIGLRSVARRYTQRARRLANGNNFEGARRALESARSTFPGLSEIERVSRFVESKAAAPDS